MLTFIPLDITLPQWSPPVGDLAHRRCAIFHSLRLAYLRWSIQLWVWKVATNTAMISCDLLRNNMSLTWIFLTFLERLDLSQGCSHVFLWTVYREVIFKGPVVQIPSWAAAALDISLSLVCAIDLICVIANISSKR